MAQQRGQKLHHGFGQTGDRDERAQEHKQGHREQDQVGHAFIDAADHDGEWCAGGKLQIGQGAQPEGKRDGQTHDHAHAHHQHEKQQQIAMAKVHQERAGPVKRSAQHQQAAQRPSQVGTPRSPRQLQQRLQQHEPQTHHHRRHAQRIRDFQGGCQDDPLLVHVLDGWPQQSRTKQDREAGHQTLDFAALRLRQLGDKHGQAHVLAVLHGDHRTEHGQPQEQHRREFVRPGERGLQHIAVNHAQGQHDDFGQHQQSRWPLGQGPQHPLRPRQGHANLPVYFSSLPMASGPYLVFHSW